MNRAFTLLTVLLGSLSLSSYAQVYDEVRGNNLWNDGWNVAGMRQDSTSVAEAKIYGGALTGGFHSYGDASTMWKAGVETSAIRHLRRLSLMGSFSFENRTGYNMYGSMFTEPGYFPVDILEFTSGRKDLQEYSISGAISYDLGSQWRLGAGIDFRSANYAKRKDLRHTNYRLDLCVAPSVMWHCGDWAVGLTFLLGKDSETVNAEVIGLSGPTYYAFFDKGLMYGLYEGWEGSGIHLSVSGVNGFPVKELFVGGSAQVSWKGLYADVAYKYRKGKIGEKDYIWYEYPGYEIESSIGYNHTEGEDRHIVRVGFAFKDQKNYENILETTVSGGVSTVTKYADNKILERRLFDITPEYEYISPLWKLKWQGKAHIFNGVSSQKYPFVYLQDICEFSTSLSSLIHLGKFDLGAELGFGKGLFKEEGASLFPVSSSLSPARYKEYTDYSIEYIKASRLNASLSLRFNFWKGLYVQADGAFTYAFGLKKIKSPYRAGGNISIGYNF